MISDKLRNPAFWKVVFPLLLVIATLALGTAGFHQHHLPGEPVPWQEAFLMAAGLPVLETTSALIPGAPVPWTLNAARFLGLLIPPYAFVLAILFAFRDPVKQAVVASWALRPWTKHAVVCGLGWKGRELVGDLREHGFKVAAIDHDPEESLADSAGGPGIVVFTGDATAPQGLRHAGIARADKIYVVCGDDELNCRVVNQLVSVLPATDSPPRCYVHLEDGHLRHYLCNRTAGLGNIEVTCFNTWETTARRLLRDHPIDRFGGLTKERKGVADVTIVGSSEMARAILLQTLRLGHFGPNRNLVVRVMAENVAAYRDQLYRAMPCLAPDWVEPESQARRLRDEVFPTIEFEELPDSDSELLEDESPVFGGMSQCWARSIFVCVDDGYRSEALISRFLPKLQLLHERHGVDLQVGCYYNYLEDVQNELARLLDDETPPSLKIFDFGSYAQECSVEAVEGRTVDELARQISAFYEQKHGSGPPQDAPAEERATHFDRLWRESGEWARESNRQAADHIAVKLRSLGMEVRDSPEDAETGSVLATADHRPADEAFFERDEKEQLARMEHRRWCAERLLGGWRPLPRTEENLRAWERDKKAFQNQKMHIDLVPFDELPEEEKGKDYDHIEAIPALLRAVGKEIVRDQESRA
mgnify:CR=1 FL=1